MAMLGCSLRLSHIPYANLCRVGALENPQWTLVGARRVHITQDLQFLCLGTYASHTLSLSLSLSLSGSLSVSLSLSLSLTHSLSLSLSLR